MFDKYNILREINCKGKFIITASQIKEFSEQRLMTKFDYIVNLPKLFFDNNLSVLPISSNSYIISHFKAYYKFEDITEETIRITLPKQIQSMTCINISRKPVILGWVDKNF